MATPAQAETDSSWNEDDWGDDLFEASLDFVDNPGSRCPCVLLLDTSESMAGAPLAALQQGLEAFRSQVLASPQLRRRLEVGIVSFGSPVRVVQPLASLEHWQPPHLQAQGETPMGGGILAALDLIEARRKQYRANGVPSSPPCLLLVTDGMPQGESLEVLRQAVQRLRAMQDQQGLTFIPVAVAGANKTLLGRLAGRPPLQLDGLRFTDLFSWLSTSMEQLSGSRRGQTLALPAEGWSVS